MKYAIMQLVTTKTRGQEWQLLGRIYATEFEASQRARKSPRLIVVALLLEPDPK